MKKLGIISMLMMIVLSSCSLSKVDGDEVGIFNKKPLFFGSGGVSTEVLSQGSTWKVFSTEFIKFKKVPIKYSEEFQDIMSDDNTPLDLNAHIFLEIDEAKPNILYVNYGLEWYENNIKEKFRKTVRDRISGYPMYDLTSNREVFDVIEPDVIKIMKEYLEELNKSKEFPIFVINVIVDRATPGNEKIAEQVTATAAQIQGKQTQIRQREMEEERTKTENQRAIADMAYKNKMGFSNKEYLYNKQLEIIEKNGSKVNLIMGGGAQPIFDPTK